MAVVTAVASPRPTLTPMTLHECQRLTAGDYVFHDTAVWRVASPPLIRRRSGTRVRIEAASGPGGLAVEVAPDSLRAFGRRWRMSDANRALAVRLRTLVQGYVRAHPLPHRVSKG